MATKVKKNVLKKDPEELNLGELLKIRKDQIVGLQLKDGSLLLGSVIEVFVDSDYGIWFRFDGVSPLAPKQNATLSEFLKDGVKNPEAMIISGLFPLSQVNHFIFGITTGRLMKEQEQINHEQKGKIVDFSKDAKMEMKVKQEKIESTEGDNSNKKVN